MEKIHLLIISILLFINITKAQTNIALAQQMQEKYKDADMYILNSTDELKLEKNTFNKNVTINYSKKDKYLALRINKTIPLYEYYDKFSEVKSFKAVSDLKQKRNDDQKYCGTYTSKNVFYDDTKYCSQILNLKEVGEIWDVEALLSFKDAKYVTSVYFLNDYPTKEKTINLIYNKDIEVEIKEFNLEGQNVTKTEKEENGNKIISYTIQNCPAFENVNFKQGYQFTYPHIVLLVKGYAMGNSKTNLLSNTADMYNWYKSLLKQLTPNNSAFKPVVENLIANDKTEKEKLEHIFYWVQDNIRYIAFEDGIAGYKPEEAHVVYEKKYGDCKGMANLMKEMLLLAKIDARIAWIGTNSIKHDFSTPSLCVNNHMICAVKYDNQFIYLDGTEKHNALFDYAERIQGRQVMIEDGENYKIETVPVTPTIANLKNTELKIELQSEKLIGNGTTYFNGETKRSILHNYYETENDKKNDFIKQELNENKTSIHSDVKLVNFKREGTIEINYLIELKNCITAYNNELYISLETTKPLSNLKVTNDRLSDLYFGEKIFQTHITHFKIPENYKITNLPSSLSIKDIEYEIDFNFKEDNGYIIYSKKIVFPNAKISKKNFEKWNNTIKQINKFYQEQITLTKNI